MTPHSSFRKTKIICTIGPATSSFDNLKALHQAGMNIARLNMSHGDHDSHREVIKRIKTINKTAVHPIAILLDTQGPEIRTGDVAENVMLNVGEEIEITIYEENIENKSAIMVNYKDMVNDLNPGDRVTVDNGIINLEVIEKGEFKLKCRVIDGGLLKSRRHINLPGIRVNLPSITAKDRHDIEFAIKEDLDFIALSFVRTADDVEECKGIIDSSNHHAQVIAKIEDSLGSDNYKAIIAASHGVMVARGDLGIEVPLEDLPIIQRRIVKEAAEQGKRVIIATHLLESMIENPIPTRAEVTDVANAVYEEADGIMLSGETTIGKYPVKAVSYLDSISRRIERSGGLRWAEKRIASGQKAKLARAAVELADNMRAQGMVVITRRGVTADNVSSFHPRFSPIFAFTNMSTVRRKLVLNRGCFAFRIDFSNDPERTIRNAFSLLKKRGLVHEGATIVVVSDVLAGDFRVDAIQVRTIT